VPHAAGKDRQAWVTGQVGHAYGGQQP
jgi:hypothetical protein